MDIEAKTFSEFSAPQLGPTLSALANLPGGGTILLGVDERSEEMLVGVTDPVQWRQQAVDLARGKATDLAVSIDTECFTIDGKTVVVINVDETPINKLCRYKKVAYKRQFDGDHRMSLQEEQQLLLRHMRPRADVSPVPGTSRDDLSQPLVASFVDSVRRGTSTLTQASEEEILVNLNVMTEDGTLTVAGLYALGVYPQRCLPHLSLTGLSLTQVEALIIMRHGASFSNSEYRSRFSVDSTRARQELQDLVARGVVRSTGSRRYTRYCLADSPG